MKKIISVTALVMVFAMLFCACGKQAKPLGDVFSEIKTTYQVSDLVEFSDAADLNRFYGITAEDVKEFAGGINNSGVNQEEIVMILAADADAASRVATALTNRYQSKLNETKNYNPEQYAMLEKCSVDTDNNYVTMFLSANAASMKEAFKKAIG